MGVFLQALLVFNQEVYVFLVIFWNLRWRNDLQLTPLLCLLVVINIFSAAGCRHDTIIHLLQLIASLLHPRRSSCRHQLPSRASHRLGACLRIKPIRLHSMRLLHELLIVIVSFLNLPIIINTLRPNPESLLCLLLVLVRINWVWHAKVNSVEVLLHALGVLVGRRLLMDKLGRI